jgi:hypothetical protein
MDCVASLAMTPENSGNSPLAPAESLRHAPRAPPHAVAEVPSAARHSPFSNDNAEFYERKIVTSKSKSCLMVFMDASYKLFK